MSGRDGRNPAPGPRDEPTRVLPPGGHAAAPPPGHAGSEDTGYSATVLGSHWIRRPADDTLAEGPGVTLRAAPPPPDRVEGDLLRFGPGVTAAGPHGTLPAVPSAAPVRGRPLRRYALPALVLVCVLAFLAWQRLGPSVEVRAVTVTASPGVLRCGGTADIVAVVRTNGRPGTLSYRWIRSDGTASGELREVLVRGQRQARLHLRWTFQGEGRRAARAGLELVAPARSTASARFTYDCR